MVYFIGAGPGDPELITIKALKLLQNADVIIYAGSLVNKEILKYAPDSCATYNSAEMDLEQIVDIMSKAYVQGKIVIRLHTGDPSIFGAIREQMDELERRNVEYEVVPGVSSFCAAAAVLKKEYTLPEVSQTVILARMQGRTLVPGEQAIEKLASHKATMIIFLSIHMIDELVEKLKTGYSDDTPAAVVYKASWPDQKVLTGTLATISSLVKKNHITKTALLLIGDFLGDEYQLSKLYDKNFSHEYRSANS